MEDQPGWRHSDFTDGQGKPIVEETGNTMENTSRNKPNDNNQWINTQAGAPSVGSSSSPTVRQLDVSFPTYSRSIYRNSTMKS